MTPILARETLIYTIAKLLEGVRHVAVGASSPIPAAGAMLRRALNEREDKEAVRISVLGSVEYNFFTNGSTELFDCAGQGRIDSFFLGGGQIDGKGNINLVGVGDYPQNTVRWPGSFGSAYLYFVVPRVILFREEHSSRVFVDKVDFISAPGVSDKDVYRKGGPYALLTSKGLFYFDKDQENFRLASLHAGHDLGEVTAATGFSFDHSPKPDTTPEPDSSILQIMRGRVLDELSETYPQFATEMRRAIEALSSGARECIPK